MRCVVFLIDFLWFSRDGTFVGPASKAFFCDDLTGQNYLCYLLPTKLQLCMVKLDFSHNGNFIFGVFTSMSARDAVPVPVSCVLVFWLDLNKSFANLKFLPKNKIYLNFLYL